MLRNKNIRKLLFGSIKILIVIIAWWYIYKKLFASDQDYSSIVFTPRIWQGIIVVFVLMFANWLLEAKKWQVLVHKIVPISLTTAFQGTLIGITFGFITPNRIGDIGGRSIVLPSSKKRGIIATSIGSMLQFATTILFGILGITILFFFIPHTHTIQYLIYICFAILILSFFIIRLSFRKKYLHQIILRIMGKSRYRKFIQTLQLYSLETLLFAGMFAVFRYIIFSTQYTLLLLIFIPEISAIECITGITLTYLFVTLIPSSILGELGIRGSVSVFIFGLFAAPALQIFLVSLILWIINLAIPVVFGSILLLLHKQKNSTLTK